MSQLSSNGLKYKQLSQIETNLLSQIKLVFILTKYDASDVIFVTTTDDVYGYGTNKYGRLGLGHATAVLKPTKIEELCAKNVMDIEYGQKYMAAITESMAVFICGYDSMGSGYYLGSRRNGDRKPKKINLGNILVADIKCCLDKIYLLTDTNDIYFFGYSPNIFHITQTPTLINTFPVDKFIAISCGNNDILALTQTGKVYTGDLDHHRHFERGWTNNASYLQDMNQDLYDQDHYLYYNSGIYSDGISRVNTLEIFRLPANVFIKQISCGNSHNILLSSEGEVYSFGFNDFGQLGTGQYGDNYSPKQPKLIRIKCKIIEIFAFENTSMALTDSTNVLVWGELRDRNSITPFLTNAHSIQEAIIVCSKTQFTYKPLTTQDILQDYQGLTDPRCQVIETMAKAFNDLKYSDLKFKLKHKGRENFGYIYGHKWFIANSSEHFERMFANNWSENKSNEIEINGYSHEAYYQFIRCLYTDCIETKDIELLIELLAITDEYLDDKIKTKCVQSIKPLMNIQNVSALYSSALRNRSKELEEYSFKLMSKQISNVVDTESFKLMDASYAKHFLVKFAKLPKGRW